MKFCCDIITLASRVTFPHQNKFNVVSKFYVELFWNWNMHVQNHISKYNKGRAYLFM